MTAFAALAARATDASWWWRIVRDWQESERHRLAGTNRPDVIAAHPAFFGDLRDRA